ncbi:recombinase RecJ [Croceibacterium mercuriale]|uniref:Single-stranded-DNA-specific exonuclease RecJ n=1 Tax=Croceibacterium mercuriale TaxID=1572751 RepID=A0A0B2C0Y7_9SPHN|nr:single-stranded-DNA-specific exonuclease RecJ [Croceibacterium mercuriale]KHL25947.1 recombinase RecJ [Croceibacterium mercuriale]
MATCPALLGIEQSLSGKAWHWRGGDASGADGTAGLGHDLVTHLLLSRGVERHDVPRHRTPSLRDFMPDPSLFKDMDRAAERIADAVIAREQVAVFGDYDVDGATSAALLIRLLRMLGHNASHYIPDRLTEGYGPTEAALLGLGRAGSTLIVTVDCGVTAFAPLAAAHEAGIDVVVVDHHKCTADLPLAYAVVNPNRVDEDETGTAHGHLAAVGVAFLLAVAIVRVLRQRGHFAGGSEPDLLSLLDLVALGTVADVAAIRGLNRAFVAQGLKVMRRRANPGIAALIDASRLSRAPTCSDCGFALGPRINAGGRVGDAALGVRLLTTSDPEEARMIAARLDLLNEERRAIEQSVQDAAEEQAAGQTDRAVLVVSGPEWHQGVIGIVAGRLKEKYGKPAIVIAQDVATGQAKGSGRSITGVDLGAAIIGARDSGLLVAGGGHAMAAGLTVENGRVAEFASWIEAHLAASVARAGTGSALLLDLALAPRGLTAELVEELEAAGPFGVGWPGPRVVVGPVHLVRADVVGNGHVRLIAGGADGASVKAVGFRMAETLLGQTLLHGARGRRLWLAGRARTDDWGATPRAELHLDDAAFAD